MTDRIVLFIQCCNRCLIAAILQEDPISYHLTKSVAWVRMHARYELLSAITVRIVAGKVAHHLYHRFQAEEI